MKIENKKAFFDYTVVEKWEAGVVLTGAEVKSVKEGAMSLMGGRCVFIESPTSPKATQGNQPELWLVGVQINPYKYANNPNYDPIRSRKLLLTIKELTEIKIKLATKGLTLIPISCYTKHGLVKIEIALAKGKKIYEKREVEKKRAIDRGVQKLLKNKNN
jgi:SsrA-binding protein